MDLQLSLQKFELAQISHVKNVHTYVLWKLAKSPSKLLKVVPIEHLSRPFIARLEEIM